MFHVFYTVKGRPGCWRLIDVAQSSAGKPRAWLFNDQTGERLQVHPRKLRVSHVENYVPHGHNDRLPRRRDSYPRTGEEGLTEHQKYEVRQWQGAQRCELGPDAPWVRP